MNSYNKIGIIHCTYQGVSGYNLKKVLYFGGISSRSSLFVKVPVMGFPVKVLKQTN